MNSSSPVLRFVGITLTIGLFFAALYQGDWIVGIHRTPDYAHAAFLMAFAVFFKVGNRAQ